MGEWGAALLYVRAACRRQMLGVACFHVRAARRRQVVRLRYVTEKQGRQRTGQGNKQNSALAQP
ncbi:MAG: hypothetical protein V7K71_15810 [Nostoc sp.]|uniref:hypothetical protein n=1 Tax=Nostoc sp. TaxID=1180 RepID=UPI002FF99F20